MREFTHALAVAVLLAGLAAAQPSITAGGVVNGASYIPPGLPNSAIAQGSIFIIKGSNLGPSTLKMADAPRPSNLAGTSIKVMIGSTSVDALMLYTSAAQVAAVLPSKTPVGTGTVAVTYNNQTSATAPITVTQSSFGIFTINQAGSGPGVFTNASWQVNLLTASAKPHDPMVVWGTGLGPASFPEDVGAPAVDMRAFLDVQVLVGGKVAQLAFAGRAPGYTGLDQINFEVPDGVEGCYVPVIVKVNGVVSNSATISIASSGGICSDPTSFSVADLQKAQSNGKFRLGTVYLNRMDLALPQVIPGVTLGSMKTDTGSATFAEYDFAKLIGSRGVSGFAPYGQCLVYTMTGSTASLPVDPIAPTGLDAGMLTITGPNGAKTFTKNSKGNYSAQLGGGGIPGFPGGQPDYLNKGTYTLSNGSGGTDIGAFTATLNIPDPLVWSNKDSVSDVARAQDLLVTWTGGSANEYVTIMGFSMKNNPQVGAGFACTERASVGRFNVPANVLAALPVSDVSSEGGISVPTGLLMIGSWPVLDQNTRFTATGLDEGYFVYNTMSGKSVNFK